MKDKLTKIKNHVGMDRSTRHPSGPGPRARLPAGSAGTRAPGPMNRVLILGYLWWFVVFMIILDICLVVVWLIT